ncbi:MULTISPECIES: hemerythrin domain-containing protein [unclassified Bacillus (in: firmicutes)]|uniref:hemerythrin domain-containing protein n=1 Tax=unclassified Bacillus (in: firmicutes) TaxID=185979 RepID=UPI0008E0FD3C|nr:MULTISPECIES: hemerythrin domain-containing protein [unclassified Bacillus (in: firmicutes)]SFA77139.1 Hemerythrin HHE cation binding domain-containing protein [Bacillus sp. UNCCL13]SFQ67043.1 Hemerythrin HHE cation binding domain-containing protein [Bacillus sp. cl95]
MTEIMGCMGAFGGVNESDLCDGLRQLKGEHPPLINRLEGLLEACLKIESGEELSVNFNSLKEKVEAFIKELEPHSEREESILFPMMSNYIGKSMGPIAVMEYEHDLAKSLISTFIEQSASSTELSEGKMKELALMIKKAYYTLVDHFTKEENVLFPMAQRMLTEEEKQELYFRIQEI